MERLTTDSPNGNFETMLNFVYEKDGWAYIRHDGEHENVKLTDWAKRRCLIRGCDEVFTETPEEIDQRLCDCMIEVPICPIALAYCFASQAVHLRSRLKLYEDTGLEPEKISALCSMSERAKMANLLRLEEYQTLGTIDHLRELAQAEKDGGLVVLPEESEKLTEEEIAEITGYKCPICVHHRLCTMPGMKPLCGEHYNHFAPEADAALKKREEADNVVQISRSAGSV